MDGGAEPRREGSVTPICPYCEQPSVLATGVDVYPHLPELAEKRFYLCRPCGAYVGVHAKTLEPMGNLADSALRRARIRAHAAFDVLWRGKGRKARHAAYRWLAEATGIPRSECHIAMMDVARCRLVVVACEERHQNGAAA